MEWIEQLQACLEKPHQLVPAEPTPSVLVLLGDRGGRHEILLTKRTQTVATHKGQISFPGGYSEKADKDLLHTALRETQEEVGIAARDIRILGALKVSHTRAQIPIYPWVGVTPYPRAFTLNAQEVEKVLSLSVESFLEQGLQSVEVVIGPAKVLSRGIYVEGELVWGATARMLEDLWTRLKQLPALSDPGQ